MPYGTIRRPDTREQPNLIVNKQNACKRGVHTRSFGWLNVSWLWMSDSVRSSVPIDASAVRERLHRPAAPHSWCWDIMWLGGPARGLFYYLYMVIRLYSRKIVGWDVYERESADYASVLMRRAVLSEQCIALPQVLHSDNGSMQKTSTLMATLDALGVEPSYSRLRVSNDNAFSELLFRTCKNRPDYPVRCFATWL